MEEMSEKLSEKSVYCLIQVSQSEHIGEMSTVNGLKSFWKIVWHMKVPHKVWIFTWRTCKEILSTCQNLRRRKMQVDKSCVFYKAPLKDTIHVVFICLELVSWWHNYLPLTKKAAHHSNLLDLGRWELKWGSKVEFKCFFLWAWSIWGEEIRKSMRIF